MGSREEILSTLRAARPPEQPLPDVPSAVLQMATPRDELARILSEIGARVVTAPTGELDAALSQVPEYATAKKVVSFVPGVARANVNVASVTDPHAYDDVDFCVLQGELGVAENGAIWVREQGDRPTRASWFLTQHVAIVLPANAVVPDLHAAYAKLSVGQQRGFAAFIAGPSRTADIEQALVVGAHGPRSCTVVLVD